MTVGSAYPTHGRRVAQAVCSLPQTMDGYYSLQVNERQMYVGKIACSSLTLFRIPEPELCLQSTCTTAGLQLPPQQLTLLPLTLAAMGQETHSSRQQFYCGLPGVLSQGLPAFLTCHPPSSPITTTPCRSSITTTPCPSHTVVAGLCHLPVVC